MLRSLSRYLIFGAVGLIGLSGPAEARTPTLARLSFWVPPERLEAFAAVLRGEVMVHVHSHYPSELMMVMHLAKEFDFIDRLVFAHASESYLIAEVIAETKAIPVIGPVMIVRFFGDNRSHNVVKELMGHSKAETTLRYYNQVDKDHEKKAARVIQSIIESAYQPEKNDVELTYKSTSYQKEHVE